MGRASPLAGDDGRILTAWKSLRERMVAVCVSDKHMPDETQPAATGIIHRAHAIEFGVKVLIGIAAAIGSLGGLFVQKALSLCVRGRKMW
jgi:hypothetical protein